MIYNQGNNLGKTIRKQRVAAQLTLQEVSAMSGVSPSYLGRIENGERFPSARILGRIAKPLGFEENELFTLAGYLSSPSPGGVTNNLPHSARGLDPYVAGVLGQEPIEVQRAVVGVLTILRNMARGISREGS